ncbi:MAG: hypothetical protein RJA81_362 [Planctomycetota bacterium]
MEKMENQDELWRFEDPDENPGTETQRNQTEPDSTEPDPAEETSQYKDELNLAEFPIAALTDRIPDGQNTLVFEDHLEQRDGPPIVRRLSISGHGKLGLPAALDDQVIVGLIQLTKRQNNFTNSRVYFSRYELIELLGWPQDGHSYRRIEEALNRWVGVVLSYENAWWDNSEKSWVDETFHIIDNVTLYDREKAMNKARSAKSKPPKPLSSFKWNDVMFRSFQSGNLKQLDLEYYLSLRLPTAKRLYRFLDKRFYHRERVDFDLRTLACEHVGMSREYAPTELKRRLRPALEELERSGFLEKLNDNERYLNVEKGRWRILFVRGPKRRAEEDEAKAHNTREALFSELTSRGVHHLVSKDLLERYEADHIRAKLEVFDWFMSHEQENVIRNPAGYLVASIRDDYAMPDEFMPKLKRVKKTRKTAAKAGRQTGETEAEHTQNGPQTASVADKSQGALKHQEEEDRRLEMQWQAMPAEIRHQITESVNNKHTGLLRWPAMMMPMYLEEMQRMYGESPPVEKIDAGMAVSLTEKILNEEDAQNKQK